MLSMGSISATEILHMIYLSGDNGIAGICRRLGWLPLALLTLTLKAEVTGLDDGEWVIVIGCGHFVPANVIGYFEIAFSILPWTFGVMSSYLIGRKLVATSF